jgi:signal transduction histidine kinase
VLLLLAGVQTVWYRSLSQLVQAVTLADEQSRLQSAVHAAAASLTVAEVAEHEYLANGDRSRLPAFDTAQVSAVGQLDFAEHLATPRDSAAVRAIGRMVLDVLDRMHRRIDQHALGRGRTARDRDSAIVEMRQLEQVRLAVLGFDAVVNAGLDARRFASGSAVSRTIAITGLVFLAAFAIAGRLLVWLEHEITRRREAEANAIVAKEEAERLSHAKSEFLAHVSHELRTPLNSVIGFSNVLLRKATGQDAVYLERVHANGTHLLALIENLLDLAKIEAGKDGVDLSVVPLDGLVRETVHELEGRLIGGNVRLETDVPRNVVPLLSDMRKLKQVLINLVGNAIKFTETGRVLVRIRTDPVTAEPIAVDVIDTGIGIPPEMQRRIFEAFEQGDHQTLRRYGGTGLGLAIAQAYCEMLGYRISVVSEVGQGSTFSVDLSAGIAARHLDESVPAVPVLVA